MGGCAKRARKARPRRGFYTWTLPPPAESLTPELARDWLQRRYEPLSRLAFRGFYPHWLRPPRFREQIQLSLGSIALDAQRIAEACLEVLETGQPVEMRWDCFEARNPTRTRGLRRVLEYERRFPKRGTRGVLRHALKERERLAKETPRA